VFLLLFPVLLQRSWSVNTARGATDLNIRTTPTSATGVYIPFARSEAHAGPATAPDQADPWLVGALHRWAHLAGGEPRNDGEPSILFEREFSGDWRGATDGWMRRGCP
jgi:hypothetical protein